MNDNKVLLLAVAYNDDTNTYSVDIPAGSNVAETAFCVAVIVKCMLRDGVIPDAKTFTDMLDKYITDPQYGEVQDNEQVQ